MQTGRTSHSAQRRRGPARRGARLVWMRRRAGAVRWPPRARPAPALGDDCTCRCRTPDKGHASSERADKVCPRRRPDPTLIGARPAARQCSRDDGHRAPPAVTGAAAAHPPPTGHRRQSRPMGAAGGTGAGVPARCPFYQHPTGWLLLMNIVHARMHSDESDARLERHDCGGRAVQLRVSGSQVLFP